MRKILFIFCSITVFSVACNNNKEASKSREMNYEKGNLTVEEAYIQQEVPGTESAETRQYITLKFSENVLTHVMVDSIQLNTTSYQIKEKTVSIVQGNQVRQELDKKGGIFYIDDAPPIELILFYTKDNLSYRQTVSPILLKEPIYLP